MAYAVLGADFPHGSGRQIALSSLWALAIVEMDIDGWDRGCASSVGGGHVVAGGRRVLARDGNRRWAYPYDVRGQRRPFSEMPRQVWDLEDDVCRSLAAFAREAGADEKTGVPLEEFRWADLFRAMLLLPKNDEEFEKVLSQAMDLAKTDAAIGMPGYRGKSKGR